MGHIEVCPGCEALEQEKAHIQDAADHGQKGLKAYLVPRELAGQLEAETGYDAAAVTGG